MKINVAELVMNDDILECKGEEDILTKENEMAMKLLFGISTDDNYSSEKQNNLGHRQFQ
jgi:hypothetical protein